MDARVTTPGGRYFEISPTEVRTFNQCRMQWWFSSVNGLNLTPNLTPVPLFIGRIFHTGIETWNAVVSAFPKGEANYDLAAGTSLDALAAEADTIFNDEHFVEAAAHQPTEYYAEAVDQASSLFDAFTAWAPGRWYPIAGEIERRRLVNIPSLSGAATPAWLSFKPDALVEFEDGIWIFEAKTKNKRPGREAPEMELDTQMSLYIWGMRRLGYSVKGVLRMTAYKLNCREPTLTQKGKLSRAKITTTYELVERAIRRHDLPREDYQEWLNELKDSPHPLFDLERFQRSEKQLVNTAQMLYHNYRMMKESRVVLNPGPLCGWCSFKLPCKLCLQGADYEWVLKEDFHEREDYR